MIYQLTCVINNNCKYNSKFKHRAAHLVYVTFYMFYMYSVLLRCKLNYPGCCYDNNIPHHRWMSTSVAQLGQLLLQIYIVTTHWKRMKNWCWSNESANEIWTMIKICPMHFFFSFISHFPPWFIIIDKGNTKVLYYSWLCMLSRFDMVI